MGPLKKYQEFLNEREPKSMPDDAGSYWQNYKRWHRYKAGQRSIVYINVLIACLVVGPLFFGALMYTVSHPNDTDALYALGAFAVVVGPLIILGLVVRSIVKLLKRRRHEESSN